MSLYGALAKDQALGELKDATNRPTARNNLGVYAGSVTVAGGLANVTITGPSNSAQPIAVFWNITRAGVNLAGGSFIYITNILGFNTGGGYTLTNGDVIYYCLIFDTP